MSVLGNTVVLFSAFGNETVANPCVQFSESPVGYGNAALVLLRSTRLHRPCDSVAGPNHQSPEEWGLEERGEERFNELARSLPGNCPKRLNQIFHVRPSFCGFTPHHRVIQSSSPVF